MTSAFEAQPRSPKPENHAVVNILQRQSIPVQAAGDDENEREGFAHIDETFLYFLHQ